MGCLSNSIGFENLHDLFKNCLRFQQIDIPLGELPSKLIGMKPWPHDWYFNDDILTYGFLKKKRLRFDLAITKCVPITTVDDKSALVHAMTLPKLMMTQYPMHWRVRMPFAINGLIALIFFLSCRYVLN